MESWEERLAGMRPQLQEQQARLRERVRDAVEALLNGESTAAEVGLLVTGEEHLLLGVNVGRDYLLDSLLAAWEMHATGRTVEEVRTELEEGLAAGTLGRRGRAEDQRRAVRLVPHIATLSAHLVMWDGCSVEEYVELARTWIRVEELEDVPEEAFTRFAWSEGTSVEDAVQAGLVLLTWLEEQLVRTLEA